MCVLGCEKPETAAKGLCWTHYHRLRKYGSVDTFYALRGPLEKRLRLYTDKNGPIPEYAPHLGHCWIWTGSKSSLGYGQIKVNGHIRYAHRIVWEQTTGAPPALPLDHLCRVPSCVNPSHLEPVTPGENARRSPIIQAQKNKRFCINGHDRTGVNEVHYSGRRFCRQCMYESIKRYQRRRRAAAKTAS